MEANVLPAFSRGEGKVVLRESAWEPSTALRRGLRSVARISQHRPEWLAFPVAELAEKKVRRTLWWASIITPLAFLLEIERSSEPWRWLKRSWPLVNERERTVLIKNHRLMINDSPELLRGFLDYALECEPELVIVGFFDEGCQSLVAGYELEDGGA